MNNGLEMHMQVKLILAEELMTQEVGKSLIVLVPLQPQQVFLNLNMDTYES